MQCSGSQLVAPSESHLLNIKMVTLVATSIFYVQSIRIAIATCLTSPDVTEPNVKKTKLLSELKHVEQSERVLFRLSIF